MKKKTTKKQIFSIITAIVTIFAHAAIALFGLWSYQYYKLELGTFVGIAGIIICLLIITDILFIVGFNFKDNKIKVVNLVLATILMIVGIIGSILMYRVNGAVNNVISNDGVEQYETIGVNYVIYDNDKIDDLKDLNGKKVGVVYSTGVGASSLGQEKLKDEKIDVSIKEYTTLNDLFLGLLDGEVDCAIFQSGYRSLLSSNDAYEEYVNKTIDIYNFEEKVKVGENASANKNLAVEPFNVLLIGFAPEPGGTSGLADSIILASINPQTMTATLTSVPRDSYVPIACYAGQAKDKITHSRGISRDCLMDTVANLFETEVDLYMEVNFQGIVDIVDALGGIWIDSPVEFVGQSPSDIRGEYTVWVGEGGQWVDGRQALAFARERHAMPNGDLDRAIHQQEVIAQIVERLLATKDVNKALDVLEAAGNNFSTNMSLTQLTTVFNYLVSTPNYTGLPIMGVIDLQSMRLAGYGSYSYHMGMQLPIYVYPLYKGSIAQNIDRIHDTMGEYNTINQDDYFKFFVEYPYNRGPLYYEYFNEAQVHEELPGYVLNFVKNGSNISEVEAWANQYGVNLNVVYVQEGDPRYVEGASGLVVDMSHRYGLLAANIDTFTVYVCGDIPAEDKVPNFVGKQYTEAEYWADANDYELSIKWIYEEDSDFDIKKTGQVKSQNIEAGKNKHNYSKLEIVAYEYVDTRIEIENAQMMKLENGKGTLTKIDVETWIKNNLISSSNATIKEVESELPVGTLVGYTWYNLDETKPAYTNSIFTFTVSKGPAQTTDPEVSPTPSTSPEPHSHSYSVTNEVPAGPGVAGSKTYTCSCGHSYSEEIPALPLPSTDPELSPSPETPSDPEVSGSTE